MSNGGFQVRKVAAMLAVGECHSDGSKQPSHACARQSRHARQERNQENMQKRYDMNSEITHELVELGLSLSDLKGKIGSLRKQEDEATSPTDRAES